MEARVVERLERGSAAARCAARRAAGERTAVAFRAVGIPRFGAIAFTDDRCSMRDDPEGVGRAVDQWRAAKKG
jgi:hypothetical protein